MHIPLEGIILEAKLHQTADCLLTLFSKEEGLIYAFVKHGLQRKHRLRHLLVPLTQVELICTRGYDELLFVSDGTLLHPYIHLRTSEQNLTAASQMVKTVTSMLWQRQTAPAIYHLLHYYLQALATFEPPEVLQWSFWCKILKHEGKFFPTLRCSVCQEMLPDEIQLAGHELICSKHDTEELAPVQLTQQDVVTIVHLTHSRQLREMQQIELSSDLKDKLQQIVERFVEERKR